jgi:Zn finger protein HypA/HybF involved in hydrogenase expression
MCDKRKFRLVLTGDIRTIMKSLADWAENLSPEEKEQLNEEKQVYVCNECDGIVPEDQLPQEEDWTCPHCGECSELRLAAANWVTTDEDRAWLKQIRVRPQ